MFSKIWKWLFLGVLLPCLPFGFTALAVRNHGTSLEGDFSVSHFWEHGELLLVALTLGAAGVYDVASSRMNQWKDAKMGAICLSLLVFAIASVWYVQISSCLVLKQDYDPNFVRQWSPLLFIFSIISGLSCVLLSKETRS